MFKEIFITLPIGLRMQALNLATKKLRKERVDDRLSALDRMAGREALPRDATKIADQLIQEIEKKEHEKIEMLDAATAERYVATLVAEADESCNTAKATQLLADLWSPTVYLAETSPDLKAERERVCEGLKDYGCHIVAERLLSDSTTAYEARVQRALMLASVSVHMVGQQPDEATKIQYELAKRSNISQVVWISRGAESEPTEFLRKLRNESRMNLDYLERKTLGQMQDVVFDLLGPLPFPAPPEVDPERAPLVYLICTHEDHPLLTYEHNNALLLKAFMEQQDFEVLLPQADTAEPREMRQDNREKLKKCDIAVLYWGSASEAWVREQLRELGQAVAGRPSGAFAAKVVYVTNPSTDGKRGFTTPEAFVFQHFGRFSGNLWEPFLAPLRRMRKQKMLGGSR